MLMIYPSHNTELRSVVIIPCIRSINFQILKIVTKQPAMLYWIYFVSLSFASTWPEKEPHWQLTPRADGGMSVLKPGLLPVILGSVSHFLSNKSALIDYHHHYCCLLLGTGTNVPIFRFSIWVCMNVSLLHWVPQSLAISSAPYIGNWKRTHILWVTLCHSNEQIMLEYIFKSDCFCPFNVLPMS